MLSWILDRYRYIWQRDQLIARDIHTLTQHVHTRKQRTSHTAHTASLTSDITRIAASPFSPPKCKQRLLIAQQWQWRRLFQKPHQTAASLAHISRAGAKRHLLVTVAAPAAVRLSPCAPSSSSSNSLSKRRCWQQRCQRTALVATM